MIQKNKQFVKSTFQVIIKNLDSLYLFFFKMIDIYSKIGLLNANRYVYMLKLVFFIPG